MLYVFHGPDSFTRREALAEIRRALDEDGALATNNVTFQARGTSPAEVIAACSTPPFLGANRLVILEGIAEVLAGKGKRGKRQVIRRGLYPWQALLTTFPSCRQARPWCCGWGSRTRLRTSRRWPARVKPELSGAQPERPAGLAPATGPQAGGPAGCPGGEPHRPDGGQPEAGARGRVQRPLVAGERDGQAGDSRSGRRHP